MSWEELGTYCALADEGSDNGAVTLTNSQRLEKLMLKSLWIRWEQILCVAQVLGVHTVKLQHQTYWMMIMTQMVDRVN
jgi:hypothetical protein